MQAVSDADDEDDEDVRPKNKQKKVVKAPEGRTKGKAKTKGKEMERKEKKGKGKAKNKDVRRLDFLVQPLTTVQQAEKPVPKRVQNRLREVSCLSISNKADIALVQIPVVPEPMTIDSDEGMERERGAVNGEDEDDDEDEDGEEDDEEDEEDEEDDDDDDENEDDDESEDDIGIDGGAIEKDHDDGVHGNRRYC